MALKFKPLNENVLAKPKRDVVKSAFQDADTRKDLQYAEVMAVCEGSKINIGDTIVYNPRNITNIEFEGDVYVVLFERNIVAIV